MKKLLFILLLLPAWCFGQSVTPQWRTDAFGMGYTYVGLGHRDTMWNAAKIRSYAGSAYTANGGITKTGNNFALGGTLTSAKTINTDGNTLTIGNTTDNSGILGVQTGVGAFLAGVGGGYVGQVQVNGGGFTIINQLQTTPFPINSFTLNGGNITVSDGINHKGIVHDASVNHATWTNSTYVDKKYVDSVASIGSGVLPDSTLHPNKNLYDLPNKATARINIGLNGTHTPGYGISGSNYNATANQTWTADTASSTSLLSKSRANSNYVYLFGSYTNPVWIVSLPYTKITGTPTFATLSNGYGIASLSYTTASNASVIADTTSATALVSKSRATANYVQLWGSSQTINHPISIQSATAPQIQIGNAQAGAQQFALSSLAGNSKSFIFQSSQVGRWVLTADGTPESGSNVGTDFSINSRTDAGGALKTALFIKRSTGNVLINSSTDATGALQVTGRIRVTQGLSGTAHTDSIAVHDNTSKEIKLIGPNALTDGLVGNILSKTADYTIIAGDFVSGKRTLLDLYVDATAGAVIITLPSSATFAGYEIYVTKTDAGINTVTINTVSGLNLLTTQYQSRHFMSNSSAWFNH